MMAGYRSYFEENYIAVEKKTASGKMKIRYEYFGQWYCLGCEACPYHPLKLAGPMLLSLVSFCAAATRPASVNFLPVTELAGMLQLILLIFEVFGVLQIVICKGRLDEYAYRRIGARMRYLPKAAAGLSALAAALGVLCGFAADWDLPLVLAIVCYLISLAGSILLTAVHQRMGYRKEKTGKK